MKNFIISLFLIFGFAICGFSEIRQRNTIIVLDCTGSMGGYNGAPDIWGPTKKFLKTKLEKEANSNSESIVTILPFQDKVLTPINVNLKSIDWPNIERTLDGYIKNITATNICDSWLKAESYIDETKENYIILLTDGHDNIGGSANEAARTAKLAQILRAFCNKYTNTNGFYVELTDAAILPQELQKAIEDCNELHNVNATQGIPVFGSSAENVIHVNTRDLPADIDVGFSEADTFNANLMQEESPYFKVSIKDGKISKGKLTIRVESKLGDNIEALNKAIGKDQTDLDLTIESDQVEIKNPDLELVVHTTPLRSLEIFGGSNEEISATMERKKPFLWIKGNAIDTLRWDLQPKFNDAATKAGANVKFMVKANQDLSAYTLLYNGQELTDSIFEILPSGGAVLELLVPQEVKDNNIHLKLNEIDSNNLDRINGERPQNADWTVEGEYKTSRTLFEIIFWIVVGLIVIFLVAWFCGIRNKMYPKFRGGTVTITSPYYGTISLKGKRKVIAGPTAKKQSAFDRIWRGKVSYHANPEWRSEVEITPRGRQNMRFRSPKGEYVSSPTNLWVRHSQYEIINQNDNKNKIEIQTN